MFEAILRFEPNFNTKTFKGKYPLLFAAKMARPDNLIFFQDLISCEDINLQCTTDSGKCVLNYMITNKAFCVAEIRVLLEKFTKE